MQQEETKKDERVESITDLEVSSEQAEEIQAGIKLPDLIVSSYQSGGHGHSD